MATANDVRTSATASSTPRATSPRTLGLGDAVSLIIGVIVGTAIFQSPPDIFGNVAGPGIGLLAWLIGGIVSLLGALCYAELATTYPTGGGDYTYLTRAYGRPMGFLFAWAELAVIRTGGSIAFMAYVVANYALDIYNPSAWLGAYGTLFYAVLAIVLLTALNLSGLIPGKHLNNILTAAKVLGLLTIVAVGLGWYWFGPGVASLTPATTDNVVSPTTSSSTLTSFALAMVFVFYAYGGWNEAAFVAAELKPKRKIVRALVVGTIAVTVIYLLVNLAYLGALGYAGVCESKAVASDVLALPFGAGGRLFMSILVVVSALGAINGLLFTGMRLYSTFGGEHRLFAWLSAPADAKDVSKGALFAQAGFSIFLIVLLEFAHLWRELLAKIAPLFQLSPPDTFHQTGSIYQLVNCTAPIFWLFFLLSGVAVFVLRYRDRHLERPFRVPCYPVIPLIFCSLCMFMLVKSTEYALSQQPAEAVVVFGLVLLGVPLYAYSQHAKISPILDEKSRLPIA